MTSLDSSNKYYIFLDTSYNLNLGFMDKDFNWLSFEELQSKKSSEVIHDKINELLERFKVDISMTSLFIISGPGSYTGLRVSEGLGQIFEIEDISVYSFNVFSLGNILKSEIGTKMKWIFPAFKGEVFLRELDEEEGHLVSENSEFDGEYITHGENKFTPISSLNSVDLIKNHSKKLFPAVLKNKLRDQVFYFRSLDKEFSKKA
ncbi:MAG: hypothetical protein VX341_12710 [Bdellovibrionota bacterium]|nr:hypothetical protein [Bdellovibrionota bacterium]